MALKLAIAINIASIHLGAQLQLELWPENKLKFQENKQTNSQSEASLKPAYSQPVSSQPTNSQPASSQPASQPAKQKGRKHVVCVGIYIFLTIQVKIQRKENPVWSKILKGSGSTFLWNGIPHLWNCSQYSGSTIHGCMNVEPPIHRIASKVYLISKTIYLTKSYWSAVLQWFAFFVSLFQTKLE